MNSNFYSELNPNIDYSRKNLRLDGWGSNGHDFFLKDHFLEIKNLLESEWKLGELQKSPAIPYETRVLPKLRLTKLEISAIQKISPNAYTDDYERTFHSVGKSYYDVLRLRFNLIKEFPDIVIYPKSKEEIAKLLKYASSKNFAVIPFGGGSSVVGGVEATKSRNQKAILCIDLTKMDSLLSLDETSQTATFQSGIYGPKLEKLLGERGFTLGHFPQSFEYSTLGGWVAARGSGQQSSRYGRIEKMVNSLELVTPEGEIKTWKLPAYSTGPDLNQIIVGSEGTLGVITEVTVKIHKLPETRKYVGFLFPSFTQGVNFIREVNHNGIKVSMLRLSDEDESRLFGNLANLGKTSSLYRTIKQKFIQKILDVNGVGGNKSVLLCGLDGSEEEVNSSLNRIQKIAKSFQGFYAGEKPGLSWLKTRYNMPFLRNHLLENGIGVDTLETSITYDKIFYLYEGVTKAIRSSMPILSSMCHVSHSYIDGASLYFTITFPLDIKNPIAQWTKMKSTATDAIFSLGGSVSHHHGIGLDHKKWYIKTLEATSEKALKGFKSGLDPKNIMNPGKLFS
ncbi:MAG: FAD-binding oxidoreductase [Leptospiraceae bacterium]|nr:FAD-binding oxidoreductase [Leptospiraceae bacterium]